MLDNVFKVMILIKYPVGVISIMIMCCYISFMCHVCTLVKIIVKVIPFHIELTLLCGIYTFLLFYLLVLSNPSFKNITEICL